MSSVPAANAPGRRLAAVVFLVAAVALGAATCDRLGRLGNMPEKSSPYVLALAAALALGVASGALSRLETRRDDDPLPVLRRSPPLAVRFVAVGLAALSVAGVWRLQNRPEVPLWALGVWAAGLFALPFAFPDASDSARESRRISPSLLAAVLFFLAVGAAARFAGLDRVLAVRSGDENNVALDGRLVLTGADRSDPFGTGIQSCAHLAMMPAGAGDLIGRDPIGGPRVGYALAGTLSLGAAALVAFAVGGPWAALGSLALLVLAPLHVFWSRMSDLVIFDALIVMLGVWALFRAWRLGSPRAACLAGLAAGLALYSYNGARILPVILVLALPAILLRAPGGWRRRGLLLAAVLAGAVVSATPGARFAARHPDEFNGRFNSTTIFSPGWMEGEARNFGSRARVLESQILRGTVGLLSAPSTIHYSGHPIIGPPILVALGIGGFGWLAGRRRFAAAFLLGLVVAGNLAGTAFTLPTPGASRPSSLVPALAVLGGVALAALIDLAGATAVRGVRLRTVLAAALLGGVFVMALPGYPLDPIRYAESGGRHAAFAQSASTVLATPFARRHRVFLHGLPFVNTGFPSFDYFVPDLRLIDVPPEARAERGASAFPPGLHVVSSEYVGDMTAWLGSLGVRRVIPLAHPAIPEERVGLMFLVPDGSSADCRPYRPPWEEASGDARPPAELVSEPVNVGGRSVASRHSVFEVGQIQDLFDGNPDTLVRTSPTDEAVVALAFASPRPMRRVELTTGTMDVCLLVDVELQGGRRRSFWKSFRGLPQDPTVSLDLPALETPVVAVRVRVACPGTVDCYIHIREMRLR